MQGDGKKGVHLDVSSEGYADRLGVVEDPTSRQQWSFATLMAGGSVAHLPAH